MTGYTVWIRAAGGVPAAPVRNLAPFATFVAASIHARWIEHRLAGVSGLGLRLEVRAGEERG